nr:chaperone modulator CbpM [Pseudoxanthomonas sp.]
MNIDVEDFLSQSGIRRETLTVWIEKAWITPAHGVTCVELTEVDVARAYLVRDLSDDLGVNEEGIDVALHLLDQIHGLRRLLAQLRGEIKGG